MAAVMVVMMYRGMLSSHWDHYSYTSGLRSGASPDAHHEHEHHHHENEDNHAPAVPERNPVITPRPEPHRHDEHDTIHAKNPPDRLPDGGGGGIPKSASVVHWRKQPEHFPVPTESIIPLPTDPPRQFPKIQHTFDPESPAAKEKREKRLAAVKAETERAWAGYRQYAWMHDELTPLTKRFRDPFCGWAATLVDSLDTLWIMGLKDEFDEAAKAVGDIDFTYTPQRRDIPVFETTIRYLGGLLAAYDVSGGRQGNHPVLLTKAVELAEILMGAFDTPNRMPILYYNWMPDYASQPHRAETASIAELASLSMEFTRLAQLTSENKYYDAVARITNALQDLQDRGTTIPGLFPEKLDLSGCNRTATAERARTLELSGEARLQSDAQSDDRKPPEGYKQQLAKKDLPLPGQPPASSENSAPYSVDGDETASWKCVEQGIEPEGYGYHQYSLGGSQDSAYEYFPKQDLILGGLEPKYRDLYINTVEAAKKWLLYRPMARDGRDVRFTGKVTTSPEGRPPQHAYEATHLACFVGGMFGLGGKMYERPDDVEMARKLADGCVWAYESTASGLMPEIATLVPCESMESCAFNETLWWDRLDSMAATRNRNIVDWEERQRKKKEEQKRREEEENENEKEALQLQEAEAGRRSADASLQGAAAAQVPIPRVPERPDPKPASHEEYVHDKIEAEGIPPGFASINDRRYILRPEAIESVWYMYRITGDPVWQEKGWRMFQAVLKATRTETGHSAVDGVLDPVPRKVDNMESFWLAETLKYYYLLYTTPDVISLDEWVLNTEAHPFRRPS
ncbi:seven-hairpin glycosidase [Sodiomyces alkalinus F11]|uniref:alpha-1,2-Mannosidase n=1 Tax=Sodiomyces alkalinus (strain CBS 110278 / VKM F-3762 / F11) TaxID=1314773 RepID=A0A3N2PMS9_SODAK|nr:seven-hairpin glycosidase [Sodiomyces alkalinus F11]ROT35831.1 seven-hairpin glycosidase [Sodiomyces alkalinus F11]